MSFDEIGEDIISNSQQKESNFVGTSESQKKGTVVSAAGNNVLLNTHESTPKNSIDENDNKTVKIVSKKIPRIADYIQIEYEDLDIYERCGRGSYGSVFRGLWKSRNKIVAIKKLLQLENEAEILSSCSHKNIIQFYGIVSRDSNYCIITEYADYGSLNEFIKHHDLYEEFGLNLILNWAHDIALGMNYLHSEAPMKIIHRDLKSNNVLITGNDLICKICDFGSSRFGIQTTKMTLTGTFPWMSPEIIQSKPANQSADVWSYGVVLWELITGEVPFKGIEEFQIAFLVVEKDYRLPIPNGCPPVLATLMQLCWQTEPKARPTFKQILSSLDQIDLDDNAKAEIDNLFNKNKAKWEAEIEQAFERLKKIENDLQIKEKLLEAREKRLREMEMELITNTTKLTFDDHDVNSWTEIDVYEWVKKLGSKNIGIGGYCERFLNHNINGKRLMIMSKDDLRNIGINSEGHIIDFYHEIQTLKIENTRLLNFPPLRQRSQAKLQTSMKTISFNVLVGAHLIESTSTETNSINQNSKWKMYIDIDEGDDARDLNINSCIRDVKFVNRDTFDQFYINKPPFLMKNWVKGYTNDTKVICTITYEDKVIQPRKTTIEYAPVTKTTLMQTIMLTLEDIAADNSSCLKTTTSNTSSNNSTLSAAMAIINSNIQFQAMNSSSNSSSSPLGNLLNNGASTENVWKKRNLENSVVIPQETQTKNSSDLWSGIVTGKYKINSSPAAMKKQLSEHSFNIIANEPKPDQNSSKMIRSQTVLNHAQMLITTTNANNNNSQENNQPQPHQPVISGGRLIAQRSLYETRRCSTSSNDSTQSKRSVNSSKSSSNNSYTKPPNRKLTLPVSSSNNLKPLFKRNLSGFGRGKFTHQHTNTNSVNFDSDQTSSKSTATNSTATNSTNTKTDNSKNTKKPFFY